MFSVEEVSRRFLFFAHGQVTSSDNTVGDLDVMC